MREQALIIGVDIGGTKIMAGVISVGSSGLGTRVDVTEQIATPRLAPAGFYDAVAELIRRVYHRTQEAGGHVQRLIGVAHPGRFLPDGSLARGTTPNLGSAPGQFDGIRPVEELRRRLGGEVFVENDATSQMRFGLDVLLRDPTVQRRLLGHTVVYLGPGTGMGGGVARISQAGEVIPFTDSQLFDLQVVGYGDGSLTAEELFTGPAIARLIAEANTRLKNPIHPANAEQIGRLLEIGDAPVEHRTEALRIADMQGDILASIIETIHAGRIVKVRLETLPDGRIVRHVNEPDRAWLPSDIVAVRGAKRFILGGSVGTNPVLGCHIRRRAFSVLAQRGVADIAIFQIPVASSNAGVLGTVLAILTNRIRWEPCLANLRMQLPPQR